MKLKLTLNVKTEGMYVSDLNAMADRVKQDILSNCFGGVGVTIISSMENYNYTLTSEEEEVK